MEKIKLMGNKKGLSEVVITILFILLALGAVMLVWFLVKNLVTSSSGAVNLDKACLDLSLEPMGCVTGATEASVSYKRGNLEIPAGVELKKIKLIFEMSDDSTISSDVTDVVLLPEVLGQKTAKVQNSLFGTLTPIKAGVSGIFLIDKKEEQACPESVRIVCE